MNAQPELPLHGVEPRACARRAEARPPDHAPGTAGIRDDALWVIGHRGSPVCEVENTIASFDRAVTHDGADGLEIDLSLTKDGELLLWHDWMPWGLEAWIRRAGYEPTVRFKPLLPREKRFVRPTSELYADDVQRHFGYADKHGTNERIASAKIPTFSEFLEWANRTPKLRVVFIDVKAPARDRHLLPRFLSRLDACLALSPPRFDFVLETADPVVMASMKRLAPHHRCTLDRGPVVGIVPSPERFSAVRAAVQHGNVIATLQKPRHSCYRPFWTFCRMVRHDIAARIEHNQRADAEARIHHLVGFTLNDPDEMMHLLALGLDGIQSDRPDLLRAAVARFEDQRHRLPKV